MQIFEDLVNMMNEIKNKILRVTTEDPSRMLRHTNKQ